MSNSHLIKPEIIPPLDQDFHPAILFNKKFREELKLLGDGEPIALALERTDGSISRFETKSVP